MRAEDWPTLDDPMLDPLFSEPAMELKTEQQSPPTEPVVNEEPDDDAFITNFLNSILNNEGDISCDFEIPDLAVGSDIGNNPIITEAAEQTGTQVTSS